MDVNIAYLGSGFDFPCFALNLLEIGQKVISLEIRVEIRGVERETRTVRAGSRIVVPVPSMLLLALAPRSLRFLVGGAPDIRPSRASGHAFARPWGVVLGIGSLLKTVKSLEVTRVVIRDAKLFLL